jgi:hypothetical protein
MSCKPNSSLVVTIHDEGKGRDYSIEAFLDNMPLVINYADTQEEAIAGLKIAVKELIKNLEAVDYDKIVRVDCFGNILKE